MKKLLNKDAWLDPNGKLHEVGDGMHNSFAGDLLIAEMGLDKMMENRRITKLYPFEVLHSRGWVRVRLSRFAPFVIIMGNHINLCTPMRNTSEPAMNQTQLRVAKQICEEYETTLHNAINDKRFW